jgi:type I restriction-modification system DNA methylase subunit
MGGRRSGSGARSASPIAVSWAPQTAGGMLRVPPQSRFTFLVDEAHENIGQKLNKALGGIESENIALEGVLDHIFGQESAGTVWSIAQMNMLLHPTSK